MNGLILFAPVAMTIIAVLLSVSAFYGGFHFAHLRFLEKMRELNDHIVADGDEITLAVLNDFLIKLSVENNKAKWTDWVKFGLFSGGKK